MPTSCTIWIRANHHSYFARHTWLKKFSAITIYMTTWHWEVWLLTEWTRMAFDVALELYLTVLSLILALDNQGSNSDNIVVVWIIRVRYIDSRPLMRMDQSLRERMWEICAVCCVKSQAMLTTLKNLTHW